jgi:multidrug efflux pump subunit AcrA (membrane-fusion protein)
MQIQKIDIMVAVVFVPEVYLGSIKLGTPGKITIPGLSTSYESEVALINDRLDMQTRSIDVRLGIENADYAIKPGLFIEVELYPEPRDALTLPKNVVRGLGGDRYVFVAENGLAKRRPVGIRELEDDLVEVLSGIEDGALVIQGSNLNLIQDNASVSFGAPS